MSVIRPSKKVCRLSGVTLAPHHALRWFVSDQRAAWCVI
jgi:hypothetical protein